MGKAPPHRLSAINRENMIMKDVVNLQIQIDKMVLSRLKEAAASRQISLDALVEEAIVSALPIARTTNATILPPKNFYRWKDVFLPNETVLSFQYKGNTYTAAVKDGELLFENRPVSPSEFVNSISSGVRNAWRDIWVKRPSDKVWLQASEVRAESTTAKLAKIDNDVLEVVKLFDVPKSQNHSSSAVIAPTLARRQFGTLPVSERMGPRYFQACKSVIQIISSRTASSVDLDQISEAKGMFNRIVRRDRHDWMHVQKLLGMPNLTNCRQAAAWLTELRALLTDDLPIDSHCTRPAAVTVHTALKVAMVALKDEGFGP